jgi:hypothetical protein
MDVDIFAHEDIADRVAELMQAARSAKKGRTAS